MSEVSTRRRTVAAVAALVLAALPAAAADEARTFVGPLEGASSPALVAVVVEGGAFVAYTCGADDAFNAKHAQWFKGAVKDGALEAASADGIKLTGRIDGDKVSGSVLPKEGDGFRFTAPATPPGRAGLYRAAREGEFTAGWIIDPAGKVVGACKKKGGQVSSIQPARPLPKAQADDPPVETQPQAEEALVVQPDPAAEPVQGQRVKAPAALPNGKVVRKAPVKAPAKNKK